VCVRRAAGVSASTLRAPGQVPVPDRTPDHPEPGRCKAASHRNHPCSPLRTEPLLHKPSTPTQTEPQSQDPSSDTHQTCAHTYAVFKAMLEPWGNLTRSFLLPLPYCCASAPLQGARSAASSLCCAEGSCSPPALEAEGAPGHDWGLSSDTSVTPSPPWAAPGLEHPHTPRRYLASPPMASPKPPSAPPRGKKQGGTKC